MENLGGGSLEDLDQIHFLVAFLLGFISVSLVEIAEVGTATNGLSLVF